MLSDMAKSPPQSRAAGRNVRALRHERGLSLEKVCELVEIQGVRMGINALSRIETGERRMDVDDLVALGAALGVPVEHILQNPDLRVELRARAAVQSCVSQMRHLERVRADVDADLARHGETLRVLAEEGDSARAAVVEVIDGFSDGRGELRRRLLNEVEG